MRSEQDPKLYDFQRMKWNMLKRIVLAPRVPQLSGTG